MMVMLHRRSTQNQMSNTCPVAHWYDIQNGSCQLNYRTRRRTAPEAMFFYLCLTIQCTPLYNNPTCMWDMYMDQRQNYQWREGQWPSLQPKWHALVGDWTSNLRVSRPVPYRLRHTSCYVALFCVSVWFALCVWQFQFLS